MTSITSRPSNVPPSPRTRSSSPHIPIIHDMDTRKPPHLPFRRISMTSGLANGGISSSNSQSKRASISSAASFDSLPEGEVASITWGNASDMLSPPPRTSSRLSITRSNRRSAELHRKPRPTSSDSFSSIDLNTRLKLKSGGRLSRPQSRGQSRSREPPTPLDETQNFRRLKIMLEFWETEKAYVEGLDLIYTVIIARY